MNDSYHFGQTLINDYGRPYWQGVNNISGFSASANDGRFAFYIDGEYQYAPTIPGYPLSVRQVIANADLNPLLPPTPIPANKFSLLDTYATMKYGGLDFSVGKQSMWWGPSESGAVVDERQCCSLLDAPNQPHGADQHSSAFKVPGAIRDVQLFRSIRGASVSCRALHVWAEGEL